MAWYVFHHRGVNDFQLVGTGEREAETFTIVKERGRPDQALGYRVVEAQSENEAWRRIERLLLDQDTNDQPPAPSPS